MIVHFIAEKIEYPETTIDPFVSRQQTLSYLYTSIPIQLKFKQKPGNIVYDDEPIPM